MLDGDVRNDVYNAGRLDGMKGRMYRDSLTDQWRSGGYSDDYQAGWDYARAMLDYLRNPPTNDS